MPSIDRGDGPGALAVGPGPLAAGPGQRASAWCLSLAPTCVLTKPRTIDHACMVQLAELSVEKAALATDLAALTTKLAAEVEERDAVTTKLARLQKMYVSSLCTWTCTPSRTGLAPPFRPELSCACLPRYSIAHRHVLSIPFTAWRKRSTMNWTLRKSWKTRPPKSPR